MSATAQAAVIVRQATEADAAAIRDLIDRYTGDGTLLPRTEAFVAAHAHNFLVATDPAGREVVGCVHLDEYSPSLAELRSLAVAPGWQGKGVGRTLVAATEQLARRRGHTTLFAVSNDEEFFRKYGFLRRHIPELDRERSEVSRYKGVYAKELGGAPPRPPGRRQAARRPPTPTAPPVSRLRLTIAASLDGFAAGSRQSPQDPLGVGGTRLHEWAFALEAWRKPHGIPGGEVNASSAVVEESRANVGATVMGRNLFGGQPGPWDAARPWNGWWGDDPPFHHPVFVLTHHPREPLALADTTFTFVTGGIEAALDLARRAAGGRDVTLAGGAAAARQYLAAGLVDDVLLTVAPTLLGAGERLFADADDLRGLELVRTVAAPMAVHYRFARP